MITFNGLKLAAAGGGSIAPPDIEPAAIEPEVVSPVTGTVTGERR
jgi:hypothetical protein